VTHPEPFDARRVAIAAMVRIDTDGGYANVVVPRLLAGSDLDSRDRGFVTELVYGATRRRRALDHLVAPFLVRDPPPAARAALRLGTYQLVELGTPRHAAVSATVGAAPKRYRGLVNAVLRRVADRLDSEIEWPDDATELSYPDWIVDRLRHDLGTDDANSALVAMNQRGVVHRRADGYIQDLSSQLVTASLPIERGDLAVDLCAAPGGKASAMAARGASVIAVELQRSRVGRIAENRETLGLDDLHIVVADGTSAPLRRGRADVVLVDAPCSGLGALRRRPDARWRVVEDDIVRLVELQSRLLVAASGLVAPGGTLAYSVCTLTTAETIGVADRAELAGFEPVSLGEPWRPHGSGGLVLPDEESDGMALFIWRGAGSKSLGSGHGP
jgi:16S rRNA (cytosine967-C5)-methyltransferase